jgi:hypothetical protein
VTVGVTGNVFMMCDCPRCAGVAPAPRNFKGLLERVPKIRDGRRRGLQ